MILHPKAVAATWNSPNTERRPAVVVSMKDDRRPRPCRRRRRLERRRVSGVEVFPLCVGTVVLLRVCSRLHV